MAAVAIKATVLHNYFQIESPAGSPCGAFDCMAVKVVEAILHCISSSGASAILRLLVPGNTFDNCQQKCWRFECLRDRKNERVILNPAPIINFCRTKCVLQNAVIFNDQFVAIVATSKLTLFGHRNYHGNVVQVPLKAMVILTIAQNVNLVLTNFFQHPI